MGFFILVAGVATTAKLRGFKFYHNPDYL